MNMGMMNPMQAMLTPMVQGAMERVMSRFAPQHHSMPVSEDNSKEVFRKHMAEYWDDVVQGRESASEEMVTGFCMLMMEVLPQCMKTMGYEVTNTHQHEHESCGDYKAHHKRFKEAVDKLRRAPVQDRSKLICEMFPSLKTGSLEYKILLEMIKLPSTETRAAQLGASKEQYCEAKDNLKQMYK